jgi:hypothetical protein
MNIQSITRRAGLAALLVLPLACGGKSGGSMPEKSGSGPRSDIRPPPSLPANQEDSIPAQTDFDAKATKSINAQNADAEFEKLKQEIEGDG